MPRLNPDINTELPKAFVQSQRNRFSMIWVIPMLAALIGGWLIIKNATNSSTVVKVTFQHANGIEQGKTRVKYRDINIGFVKKVGFSDDLLNVVATLQIDGLDAERLTDATRFWVVKPRFGAAGISGLETLVSGAYIEIDPGEDGEVSQEFIGLEQPHHNQLDSAGTIYNIKAKSLGSLTTGSPVHYKEIPVGEVINYQLAEDFSSVEIEIFINAPYDQHVKNNTRFWNTSGLDVKIDTEGVKMDIESLVALFTGGISYATPARIGINTRAPEKTVFPLYKTQYPQADELILFSVPFLMYFSDSVRGLAVGAAVEFRGIRIGSVVDISFDAQIEKNIIRVPVLVELEPDRIPLTNQRKWKNDAQRREVTITLVENLVKQGLRAQLQMGNLLTNNLLVVLDIFPDEDEVELIYENEYAVVPTIPGTLNSITSKVNNLLAQLNAFPFDEIGKNLNASAAGANKLLNDENLRTTILNLNSAVEKVNKLLMSSSMLDGGALGVQARMTMDELSKAARSIRVMAEYLERHPEALLKGKSAR